MKRIEAQNLPCPKPVILCQQHWETCQEPFEIEVGNEPAVQNVSKWARAQGLDPVVHALAPNHWLIVFHVKPNPATDTTPKNPSPVQLSAMKPEMSASLNPTRFASTGRLGLFVGKDTIGQGDPELGRNLARMFFYTLTQAPRKPDVIVFMNAGVFLLQDDEVLASLQTLQRQGVRLLVCGTCANFYNLSPLPIGEISNFYEIWTVLSETDSVVNLA